MTIDPAVLISLSVAGGVTLIGAAATAIVMVIKAVTDMRVAVTTLKTDVAVVQHSVDGAATALKEQNERLTVEAMRVAAEKAVEAYQKGLVEGQLRGIREGSNHPMAPPV